MPTHVYIHCNERRGVLYVGVTSDLSRRMTEHKSKLVPGFTQTYGVSRLVYCEEYDSVQDARARERSLKRWRRDWKFQLIEKSNPQWDDLTIKLLA